jgi:hypothetical protein
MITVIGWPNHEPPPLLNPIHWKRCLAPTASSADAAQPPLGLSRLTHASIRMR